MTAVIRVLLAEDHTIVRQGLRALLSGCDDVAVVGEAADGREALRKVAELEPDVVVMDLGMPGLNGVDAARRIRREHGDTQVVVLSMHGGEEYVRPAIRAGARGYLVKGSGLSDLVTAIRAVAAGEAFFSPAVAASVLDMTDEPHGRPGEPQLSEREREVLQLVAEGRSSPDIARLLELSTKTVERHRSHAMAKLGVSNVAGLVREAIRLRIVNVDG